jgi:DNA-binding transcriptional MocR family regulator
MPDGALPRYKQLAREFGTLIERGVLRPGDRIPSLRKASEQHRVSVGTIHRVYELLEERGLVEVRPQSGVYVRARAGRLTPKPDEAAALAPEPRTTKPPAASTYIDVDALIFEVLEANRRRDVVPFASSYPNPELLPLDKLNRIAATEARRMPLWASVDDTPQGNAELRRLIALRYLKSDIALSADDIVVTCGAMEAMNLSLGAVASRGDVIAIESPGYYRLLSAAQLMGLKVVEIATSPREGIDLGSLRNALQGIRIAAVVVMSNFQNPLGGTMPDANKRELASMLAAEGVPLIEDDVFTELYFGRLRPRPVKTFDKKGLVLHCGSFSKCLAPGYRVGWVAAGRYTHNVQHLKVMTSISTASLPQAALAEYLKHGGFERHLRRFRQRLSAALRDRLNTLWSANWIRQSGSQRIVGSFNNAAVGTALGQANGIQALDRSRQVIALCGDGGFNMLMCEFLTAVHHKLPVKVVVYNNSSFGLIPLEAEAAGLAPFREGIEFPNPDFAALARACGGHGFRATKPGELDAELNEAMNVDGPAIVDCVVAADEMPNLPHVNLETMGHYALAKVRETVLAVTSR